MTKLERLFIRAAKPYKFNQAELARAVEKKTRRSCSRAAVCLWCKKGYVPDDRIRAVHKITGISIDDLRKSV